MSTLSVIVPCRDAATTLPATLASLAVQRRPADEIVLVDDGSRDDGVARARAFAADPHHPLPLTVIDGAGVGASAARARGAELARGDALLFLDADDLLAPDTLGALEAALENGHAALCPWLRYEFDEEHWCVRPASCAPPWVGRDDLAAWLRGWYHPPAALLWSRAALERAGGWHPAWCVNDDGDLVMRALLAGVNLRRSNGGTAYYRRARDAATSLSGQAGGARGLHSRLDVLERLLERLDGDEAGARGSRGEAALGPERAVDLAHACRAIERDAASAAVDDALARARALETRLTPALDAARRWPRRPFTLAADVVARARRRTAMRMRPRERDVGTDAVDDAAPTPMPIAPDTLVSVVVPTFERPRETLRAVRSVLAQSWPTLELIVVDDASGDDTVARLGEISDPRLDIVRLDVNGGVARARDVGIARARGAFVALLDSDDVWYPDKLRRQLERLAATGPRLGLVYTGCDSVGEDGEFTQSMREGPCGWLPGALLERNVVNGGGSSVLLSRLALELSGGFDAGYAAIEDWDLWARIARFVEIGCVPEPLVAYRDDSHRPRRSRDIAANHAGRARFAARFETEMRRHGVLAAFLTESARRELDEPGGSRGRALALFSRAVAETVREALPPAFADAATRQGAHSPRASVRRLAASLAWLSYALLPGSVRSALRRGDAALGLTSRARRHGARLAP